MQVMPGSSWSVVDEANDLNPRSVRLLRYNAVLLHQATERQIARCSTS